MFMEKKTNRWIIAAAIVAVVAALAAVAVYVLRARNKKAWYDQDAIDCDADDCASFEFDEEDIELNEAIEEE